MNWLEEYKKWCESESIDKNLKLELEKIKDNPDEIKDRFYKNLEFGTAGLRGKMGAGTNRMNKYTVAKVTQGLAKYLLSKGEKVKEKGVVIAFDSRNFSKEFAEITALCLNAHEIKTYIFEDIRPTPELSFAIRELECEAGVVITASHNPPEYNGYKVYQNTGEQIIEPVDEEITKEIEKIKNISEIKVMKLQDAKNKNLYNIIGKNIDDKYIQKLKELILNKKEINCFGKKIKIVYTPLHGTGKMLTERILKEVGFEKVYIVKEQENPDGEFSTVKNPNPEKIEAFKLALELAKEVDADIVLANDPDADRLGMCVKNPKTGEYIYFTGNMSAMFIAEYQFSQRKKQGKLPANGILMTSIVSSDMSKAIANEYGLEFLEVLTGFKNIGASIEQMEKNNKNFVFGFEESNGCLIGDYVRDKDGVAAALSVCEAATFYMSKGITVWEQMINLYEKYGYYKESQISISFENSDNSIVDKYMKFFREGELENIGKYRTIAKRDYLKDEISYINGEKIKGNFPKSNIIYYELEKGAWVCIRPSGTEPKIKAYVGVKENSMEKAEEQIYILEKAVRDLLK